MAEISDRYLTTWILYSNPESTEQILNAIGKVSETARKFEGLVEIGAWLDKENERIINISIWETKELAAKATAEIHPQFANVPWAQGERQPAQNLLGLKSVV